MKIRDWALAPTDCVYSKYGPISKTIQSYLAITALASATVVFIDGTS